MVCKNLAQAHTSYACSFLAAFQEERRHRYLVNRFLGLPVQPRSLASAELSRSSLIAENIALRHQVDGLQRKSSAKLPVPRQDLIRQEKTRGSWPLNRGTAAKKGNRTLDLLNAIQVTGPGSPWEPEGAEGVQGEPEGYESGSCEMASKEQ